jgi:hypothetical protein
MRYANLAKEGVEFLILASPISLNNYDFPIKSPFNELLEFMKFLKYLRFITNPMKFTMIIYEAHIVFISPNRVRSSPHTSENIKSKGN